MNISILFLALGDNELTDAEKSAGWKLLFNGKDAEGWVNRESDKNVNWVAEDGTLLRKSKGTDLVYAAEQFENFELSIDWKTSGNSGVFIRMSSQKDWLNTGMEIQVLPTAGGKHGAGSLYDLIDAPKEAAVNKEWNNFFISCNGPVIWGKMNGVQMFRIDLNDEMWKTPQGKFKLPYATLPRKGWIMLQDHGATVAFRNIKIRPLKDGSSLERKLLDIAAGYKAFGQADDVSRVASTLCMPPPPPPAKVSASADKETHGQKNYFVFAKNAGAYMKKPRIEQPQGQILVKEAWLGRDKGDLFIMLKAEDAWQFGTVSAGGKVTSSGRVESCVNCHRLAKPDGVYGLPQ